ncbi:MAG: DUF6912 family protein [Peptidiphaga sp.]
MSSRRLAEPDSPSDTMTSVRIYIPATSADVSKEDLLPRLVHAVTRELEHAMPAEGEEVLESVAMGAAADDSLRILTALAQGGETIRPLRVVVVADVADSRVEPVSGDDLLPTARRLVRPVGWDAVASIHVDDDEALEDLLAAIGGDEQAFERVADEDLMWYDVEEREDLIAYFG